MIKEAFFLLPVCPKENKENSTSSPFYFITLQVLKHLFPIETGRFPAYTKKASGMIPKTLDVTDLYNRAG